MILRQDQKDAGENRGDRMTYWGQYKVKEIRDGSELRGDMTSEGNFKFRRKEEDTCKEGRWEGVTRSF